MDALTGRVVHTSGYKMGISGLGNFLRKLRAAYPDTILMLVWDNWTVHRHPQVLAQAKALGIHILWLPAYAPWTNPIEKLWRWTKQKLLHYHRKADLWDELKAQVEEFLNQFKDGSDQLLRYVGLLPN